VVLALDAALTLDNLGEYTASFSSFSDVTFQIPPPFRTRAHASSRRVFQVEARVTRTHTRTLILSCHVFQADE
jgi:hypothetical protein